MGTSLQQHGKMRTRIAFLSLFVFTILLSFGANFISGLRKAPESRVAPDHPTTFQKIGGPRTDDLPRRPPLNRRSQIMEMAAKAADETSAAAEALSNELEPTSVPKDINLGAASRDDLEALRDALKAAEANAVIFMPRYVALLKSEHDKVENYARSLDADKDSIARLLATIDKRHVEIASSASQMLTARADFYRAYEAYVAVLVGEFGAYKVVNGQFIFPVQRTVDRYNIAAHAMAVAAKRVAELEDARKRLIQLQQEQWRKLAGQND
jgi:hypothetical protein